ncbi:MAG: hydantoinase/oxoprolinase family protein [Chloroflexi bacterium]|nr:hydantoinase/oxoprolinase family protein [Chloroflexota bacterium]
MPLGVDIGGTFTDFVLVSGSRLTIHKVPSTPADHAEAFLAGLRELGDAAQGEAIVHGTTVATNALLERRGARTALVTTRGFRDVLAIGRQTRPALYALEPRRPAPLVPRELRFEVDERVDHQGRVLQPLDTASLGGILQALRQQGVESVAVCLLFSFLHPEHERQVAEVLRAAGFSVSPSYLVLPEFREYERTSATVVNAYVSPIMERYLDHLEQQLPAQGGPLRVMQSNGGIITAGAAKAAAARTVLSGPAAGVVGAAYVGGLAGFMDIISFDMGGTSTDVALVPGRLRETTEAEVGGVPIRLPMLDIHTVGAGGGSIARLDAGGALRVGPQSAGAEPGPVCYGRGDQVTVTDAHLALGRLHPQQFLAGQMPLDEARARSFLSALGQQMGLSAEEAAWGVLRVANTSMEKAIRVITVERGVDPRHFTLVAFGGAGPLHACELSEGLGIPRVLVPRYPGVLSSLGMLAADVMKDYSQTVMWTVPSAVDEGFVRQIAMGFRSLAARGWEEMTAESFDRQTAQVLTALDMRYLGQSYELVVPFDAISTADLTGRFHAAHRERFGYSMPGEPIEIVNLRLKMLGRVPRPVLPREEPGPEDAAPAMMGQRAVWFRGKTQATVYDRKRLRAGNLLAGPAIVVQMDATTALPPGWRGRVDTVGNLILERA